SRRGARVMAPRLLETSRRQFLAVAAAALGAPQVVGLIRVGAGQARAVTPLADESTASYQCLNRTEGAFVERLVRTLCPSDDLTPDGVACALAAAFDCTLASLSTAERPRVMRELRVVARAWRRDDAPSGDEASVGWIDDLFAGRISGVEPDWPHRVLS